MAINPAHVDMFKEGLDKIAGSDSEGMMALFADCVNRPRQRGYGKTVWLTSSDVFGMTTVAEVVASGVLGRHPTVIVTGTERISVPAGCRLVVLDRFPKDRLAEVKRAVPNGVNVLILSSEPPSDADMREIARPVTSFGGV